MNTRSVGRVYWHHAWYTTRSMPLVDRMDTQEIELPFRFGRAVVLRVPFSRLALVIGKWQGRADEELSLLRATGGRVVRPASALEPDEDFYE